jgi:thiol-disulfide isomerase/thioredoxin
MESIDIQQLKNAMTYAAYCQKVEELVALGKTTTIEEKPNPNILAYTFANLERMKRLDAHTELTSEILTTLSKITEPTILLDITEGWCGDASQIVPVIEHIAQANPNIEHVLIFRDEHLDIMDAFLTDGGRSIPKIVILNKKGAVLGSWGPRPESLNAIIKIWRTKMEALPTKEERKVYFETLKSEVHAWYDGDKTLSIQQEFGQVLASLLH